MLLDNSETVFTAWDREKLVGLVNAIDDSELTALVKCYSQNGFEYVDGRYVFVVQSE